MIKNVSNDFAAYIKIDIGKQLQPIEESIDDMLTRLEEFESMVALVQQERGNAVGLTGTLTQVFDQKPDLDILCAKVDVIESLVINVRETLDTLEDQIQIAEEQSGFTESNVLKNFFIPKMFKKVPEAKPNSTKEKVPLFESDKYFTPSEEDTN